MNNTFEDIANLQYNWNGYGAEPLSPELISVAKIIYDNLVIKPEIYPTAAQMIQFEWYDSKSKNCLKFEVFIDKVKIYEHCASYTGLRNIFDIDNYDAMNEVIRYFIECKLNS